MGYWKPIDNPNITNFTPDDTPTKLHIQTDYQSFSFAELMEAAKDHFGLNADELDRIEISAERIHTRCVYYDLYDPGDYDNFIVLTLREPS